MRSPGCGDVAGKLGPALVRLLLLAAITCLPPGMRIFGQAPDADPYGWLGRRVVMAVPGMQPLKDFPKVLARDAIKPSQVWKVMRVDGPRLFIQAEDSGLQGWVQAVNVVAQDQAMGRFTSVIQSRPWAGAYLMRATLWYEKHEYDKAIADLDEAIRLDPGRDLPVFGRAVTKLLARRPGAAADAIRVLELDPRGERAAYAVLTGHVAARLAGEDAVARRFLDVGAKLDPSAWPMPIVLFFRGEVTAEALLVCASNIARQTDVHCYMGYERLLAKDEPAAREHFTWARDHGDRTFREYTMALAELEWLAHRGR